MKTIMRPVLLSVLLSVVTLFCMGQKQGENPVQTIADAIAGSNVYELSSTVGFAGTASKQYERLRQLVATATDQQLLDLAARHTNSVVRLYAYQALKQKGAGIPPYLARQFEADQSMVMTLDGCIAGRKSVNELAKQKFRLVTE